MEKIKRIDDWKRSMSEGNDESQVYPDREFPQRNGKDHHCKVADLDNLNAFWGQITEITGHIRSMSVTDVLAHQKWSLAWIRIISARIDVVQDAWMDFPTQKIFSPHSAIIDATHLIRVFTDLLLRLHSRMRELYDDVWTDLHSAASDSSDPIREVIEWRKKTYPSDTPPALDREKFIKIFSDKIRGG